MRPDLARPRPPAPAHGPADRAVPPASVLRRHAVNLPLDADEVNPDGMMGGDPALASAEIGRAIFEHLTGFCARFVAHFRHLRSPRDIAGRGHGR